MVVIPNILLFEILHDNFWHDALTKNVILNYVRVLEDRLGMSSSFNVDDRACNILRAALFRLKTEGLRKKVKGGMQFQTFMKKLNESKYSWDVQVQGHCCEKSVEMEKLVSHVKEIENNVLRYAKLKETEEQTLRKETKKNESKLQKCEKDLKEKENMIDNIKSSECSVSCRKRKPFEECTVSHQSKRRKCEKELCRTALACIENETCKVTGVILERNGRQEVLNLLNDDDNSTLSESDKDLLNTLIYILDKFNISHKAYHELSCIFKTIPKSHVIQKYILDLNAGFTIMNTPDGLGVQQSLETRLQQVVKKLLSENPSMFENGIDIKLSADGTMIGKRLHVVNVTFTVLNEKRCSSADGNYPLCIVNTKEGYAELCLALADLRKEVGSLKALQVDNQSFDIRCYLGGDYKFLLLAVGIGHISAEYSCIYCKCSKKERADFTKMWSMFDENLGARLSYQQIPEQNADNRKKRGKSSKLHDNYSLCNPPLFPTIPLTRVIIDHLHLFLRVTDKLFNLMISELRMLDNISEKSVFQKLDREKIKHIAGLEHVLLMCGIDFHLNVNRDSKKLEYRDLTGPEKLKFFSKCKVSDLLDDQERSSTLQSLWDQFMVINTHIKSDCPNTDEIQPLIESWFTKFAQVYQAKDVTPYMHILRYHVVELIRLNGNIVKFSQQGLEKLNDVVTKAYFRGSNHNGLAALRQVLEKQNRVVLTERSERQPELTIKCSICKGPDHNRKSCVHDIKKNK